MNNVLIIAGMHRSGTSLVSHWLTSCGLNLGETLLGADIGNVEGHFEDVDFYRYHEDTLAAHHLSRFGMITQPLTSLSEYQKEKLKSIIDFKNKMNRQWGWKDPRTCLFLPHYRELIPGACYLNIVRDYRSTVNSLIARDFKHHEIKYLTRGRLSKIIWKSFRKGRRLNKFYRDLSEFYLNIWMAYNQEILKNIKTLPVEKYLFVEHSSLLDRDKEVFGHLKDNWHFNLEYYDFKKIFKENLLSAVINVDLFVTDKALLEKAQNLEKELKELCSKKKVIQNELL
jgi:Sulfotransferase family